MDAGKALEETMVDSGRGGTSCDGYRYSTGRDHGGLLKGWHQLAMDTLQALEETMVEFGRGGTSHDRCCRNTEDHGGLLKGWKQ